MKQQFICEKCNKIFDTQEEALECEAAHKTEEEVIDGYKARLAEIYEEKKAYMKTYAELCDEENDILKELREEYGAYSISTNEKNGKVEVNITTHPKPTHTTFSDVFSRLWEL